MDLLDRAKKLATLKVAGTGLTYIVYKTANGYNFIQRGFRKGAYEFILTKKNDKVIIRDSNDKLINTISTAKGEPKKESKPKVKKETVKSKEVEPDEGQPSEDKTVSEL